MTRFRLGSWIYFNITIPSNKQNMYPYKLNKFYGDKNKKSYQNKPIVFIFVWKLFTRAGIRDKINVMNTIGLLQEK